MQQRSFVSTPLEYFALLVASDSAFPLFEAAVSLGQDEYPALDVQGVLHEFDALLARLRARIPADAAPLHRLLMLNRHFFQDLHFTANANDYYAPDNSFLHRVLDTRRGIPVSLAVVWMELAQGLGLPAVGIAFPGHFLVRADLPQGQTVIDPLSGESLSREALLERMEACGVSPGAGDTPERLLARLLRGASSRDTLARMLRNLKDIYRTQGDWQRLLAVQERLVLLLPQCWSEYRDRGLAHAELGHTEQALADLECFMVHTEDPDAADDALRQGRGRRPS